MTRAPRDVEVSEHRAGAASVRRTTRETRVSVDLALAGSADVAVSTGIGAYDHLLSSFAQHGLFDLRIEASGDLAVDEHHTVEDVALVLGAAFDAALGDRAGIRRFGDAVVPMDESVASAAVDVGGRPYSVVDLAFRGERIGGLPTQLVEHALEALARGGGITLNVRGAGRNDHHLAEAAFKALGRAMRAACEPDPRRSGVPSTKGSLG